MIKSVEIQTLIHCFTPKFKISYVMKLILLILTFYIRNTNWGHIESWGHAKCHGCSSSHICILGLYLHIRRHSQRYCQNKYFMEIAPQFSAENVGPFLYGILSARFLPPYYFNFCFYWRNCREVRLMVAI